VFNPSSGTFRATPGTADVGVLRIRVTARDGTLFASDEFELVVDTRPNSAPVAANAAISTNEDTAVTLTLPAATDSDGDSVTYSKASNPSSGTVTISANGSATYVPAADFNGTDSFAFVVSDGRGGSTTHTASVTVIAQNDAPVVTYQVPEQVFDLGQPYDFRVPDFVGFDPEGSTLSLQVLSADGGVLPEWLKYVGASRLLSSSPGTAVAGSYDLVLRVSDGTAHTDAPFKLRVTDTLPRSTQAGTVQDGYVAGAALYIDRDRDGVADPEEDTGLRTDSNGNFSGTVFGTGNIIAVGGTNIDTGLRNTMILTAPQGASVINPVTTLVQSLVTSLQVDVATAQDKVAQAFAIPSDLDLLSFDPLKPAVNDGLSVGVQKVSAQIAVTATLSGDSQAAVGAIANVVAQAVATSGATVDLSSAATLSTISQGVSLTQAAQSAIAQGNSQIQSSSSLGSIAQSQQGVILQSLPAGVDWSAPTLDTASPAADSQEVSRAPSIVLTFSENIKLGTGTISILGEGGAVVRSFDATDSQRLTVQGKTLTIAVDAPLAYATRYEVAIAPGAVQDLAGNAFIGLTDYGFTTLPDREPPTLAMSADRISLATGQTAVLTFTLSEPAADFDIQDLLVTGGTISSFTGSGSTYSATLVPSPNSTVPAQVRVASGSFSDAAGNVNVDGGDVNNRVSVEVDTVRPSAVVTSQAESLKMGQTARIEVVLSEPSVNFSADDLQVVGGTLSGFAGSGTTYSATFTPTPGKQVSATVSVKPGAFTDAAGNASIAPEQAVAQIAVDTLAPTPTASNVPARGLGVESNITISFGEAVVAGQGLVVLKTGSGQVVETFQMGASSLVDGVLTLDPKADLKIFTPYVVELSAGAVRDLAGNDSPAGANFSFRTQSVDSLYHYFVVAFAAAPGATYMGQLVEAYNHFSALPPREGDGASAVQQIVEIFTTKPQFTGVYSESLTNRELGVALVDSIIKASATAVARQQAIDDITAALDFGWSRGKMLFTVFGNLANKPLDDPMWGNTAKQFQNQLAVARYFTESLGNDTTELAVLRGVLAPIGPDTDVSTAEKIAELIGLPPPGG
jgi:hypothetical protein